MPAPIALVQLPFAALERPSIQLALVQAHLRRAGLEARIFYLNLGFARAIGLDTYDRISRRLCRFAGEAIFARALFGQGVDDHLAWIREHLRGAGRPDAAQWDALHDIRDRASELLGAQAAALVEQLGAPPAVVGMSCTHDQLLAALAMARELRALSPSCRIVLGGAQVRGRSVGPALLEAFGDIDWIVDGEADEVVAPLFRALLSGEAPGVPHEPCGAGRGVVRGDRARLPALDELPAPDYREWLEQGPEQLGVPLELPVELSRGCWHAWRRRPCAFCGLNEAGAPGFRAKSAARIAEELTEMARRTWLVDFFATDTLLPPTSMAALEHLAAEMDLRLFAELRVSAFSHRRLQRLARAGLHRVQPGIEAFDTRLLDLLDKGTTLAENVAFLKHAEAHGIRVEYNVLYGVPGEQAADYARTIRLMPLLHHLPPPLYFYPIHLERGSPYVEEPARFGIEDIRPSPEYRFLFPQSLVDVARVAWLHTGRYASVVGDPVVVEVHEALLAWCRAHAAGAQLTMRRGPDLLRIADSRDPERPRSMVLQGPAMAVLCSILEPRGIDAIGRTTGLLPEQARAAADELVALELAIEDRGKLVGLPVPWTGACRPREVTATVWQDERLQLG